MALHAKIESGGRARGGGQKRSDCALGIYLSPNVKLKKKSMHIHPRMKWGLILPHETQSNDGRGPSLSWTAGSVIQGIADKVPFSLPRDVACSTLSGNTRNFLTTE